MGAGTCSGFILPAGSRNAVPSVGVAADGAPIFPGIPRVADHGHGNADADADDDADADADAYAYADNAALPLAPPVTPAPVSAGRHGLQPPTSWSASACGKKWTRNATINNLEAEVVNLDIKTVRALRERDFVQQEAAARRGCSSSS
eukprot:467704-Pleurochrysis_carterae.AAC.1